MAFMIVEIEDFLLEDFGYQFDNGNLGCEISSEMSSTSCFRLNGSESSDPVASSIPPSHKAKKSSKSVKKASSVFPRPVSPKTIKESDDRFAVFHDIIQKINEGNVSGLLDLSQSLCSDQCHINIEYYESVGLNHKNKPKISTEKSFLSLSVNHRLRFSLNSFAEFLKVFLDVCPDTWVSINSCQKRTPSPGKSSNVSFILVASFSFHGTIVAPFVNIVALAFPLAIEAQGTCYLEYGKSGRIENIEASFTIRK